MKSVCSLGMNQSKKKTPQKKPQQQQKTKNKGEKNNEKYIHLSAYNHTQTLKYEIITNMVPFRIGVHDS